MAKVLLTFLVCCGAGATVSACATAQKTSAAAVEAGQGGLHLASTGAKMVKTTVNETYNGFGNAVRAPLRDFNLMQEKVPVALTRAKGSVYSTDGLTSCDAIAEEIAALDLALGPDLDTPRVEYQRTRSQRLASAAADSALNAARGALDHYIPYRGVVRQLSGAKKFEKELTRANLAGAVRRGFLKAIGMQQNCAWPAAPVDFKPHAPVANVQLAANTLTPTVEAGALKDVQLVSLKVAQAELAAPAAPTPAATVAKPAPLPSAASVPTAPAPSPAPTLIAVQTASAPTAAVTPPMATAPAPSAPEAAVVPTNRAAEPVAVSPPIQLAETKPAASPASPAPVPAAAPIITLAATSSSADPAPHGSEPTRAPASALGFSGGGSTTQAAASPGLR